MSAQSIVPISNSAAPEEPRLVLHADCTTCGCVNREEDNPLSVVEIALGHTEGTGHVVVLNGTTDLPGEDWDTPALTASGAADLPTIDQILADPSASLWLRNALLAALSRDPVDAANDADVLARLLDRRCREILEANSCR